MLIHVDSPSHLAISWVLTHPNDGLDDHWPSHMHPITSQDGGRDHTQGLPEPGPWLLDTGGRGKMGRNLTNTNDRWTIDRKRGIPWEWMNIENLIWEKSMMPSKVWGVSYVQIIKHTGVEQQSGLIRWQMDHSWLWWFEMGIAPNGYEQTNTQTNILTDK
jgi:hypothetical protein